MKQNKYISRQEVINQLKNLLKTKNVLFISPTNSLVHELAKTIMFYYLKKGYEVNEDEMDILFENLGPELKTIDLAFRNYIKGFGIKKVKGDRLILTEAEIGNDKIDIVLADEKLCIEIDYKHPTSKDKIKRLERKGFKVCQININ